MVVGLCQMELQIPGSRSLKDKRRVVKSAIARLRNEYNVSVAEVGHQDAWQLTTLAVACVSGTTEQAHALLERAVEAVTAARMDIVLLDYQIEFL